MADVNRMLAAILMGRSENEKIKDGCASDEGRCPQAKNCGRHQSRGGDCSGAKEVLNTCPLEDPDFL